MKEDIFYKVDNKMNFKKQISIFLSFVIFILSPSCMGSNCKNSSTKNFTDAQYITFVPDKDIIIDSEEISKRLGTDEIKRLTFVPPDENSDNLLSKELFPHDSPKPEDVQQAYLGVCSFLAVLSALAKNQPDLIRKNLVEDGKGNVIVKFFYIEGGLPFYVKVQKTVPNLPDDLKFLRNDCLWVHMYLKAFVASGYSNIGNWLHNNYDVKLRNYKLSEGCCPTLPMGLLTGKGTQQKFFSPISDANNAENLYDSIEKTLSGGGVAVCGFVPEVDKTKLPRDSAFYEGVMSDHSYSIEGVYKGSNGQKWVVMRNPWGCYVPRYEKDGKIIVDSSYKNDGRFRLKFEDFISQPVWTYLSKNEKIGNIPLVKIPSWFYLFTCGCFAAMITMAII